MKACKDCSSTTKKLGYPGPRCLGCHRVYKIKSKRAAWDRYYRATYSMTLDEYEALYDFQNGRCFVCQWATGATKRLAVDHDHSCCKTTPTCGECTRGLLCSPCNTMLGRSRDKVEFFRRAIDYLRNPPFGRWKDSQ